MFDLPSLIRSSLIFIVLWPSFSLANQTRLTFEKNIRPILKAHCFQCHGENGVTESKLDLRLRKLIVKGGESGPALKPGSIDESILWEKLVSNEMPPEGKPVPDAQKEIIRKWIQQGANLARPEPEKASDDYMTEEEISFWSFQPITKPPIPVETLGPFQTPVDTFIHKKLKQARLDFSQRASRHVLIRRLSFDLVGLPPSPREVADFINDDSPVAYEKLVDRLLMSPRYGERWGRHWLDVAGYADSEGFTDKDPEREFAFFFRDYVIKSFNAGQPFDEFIIEQLAGDELIESPLSKLTERDSNRLKATGFLRMAPDGTASGGVDQDIAVNETIADTLKIVSTSLLGLTVGCARCHNHRYDPIRQVDYYRMRAVFEPALDWKKWKTPQQRQVSLYTEQEKKLRSGIETRAKQVESERSKKQKAHIERTLYEELLVAPDDKRAALRTAYQTEKSKRTPEQVALLETFPNIQNISTGSLYLYAEQRARRANEISAEGKKRLDRMLKNIREQALAKVPPERNQEVKQTLGVVAEKRTDSQKKLTEQYPGVFVDPSTLAKFDAPGAKLVAEYTSAAERCRKLDAKTELANMAAEAAKIRATAPREFFVRALVEPENHSPTTFLFKRGNHTQPAQQVEPGELGIINRVIPAHIENNAGNSKTTGRRLAYAKHLTSGKHPLVARVLVNRVWMHHFGKGIVETTGDFGYLGSQPSHPELLDWLATEFIDSGWDLKTLHRTILLSRTYQQESKRTQVLDEIDPTNQLYARQSPRRLESEVIRDSVLHVSHMYVNKMLGPPIPVKEDGVGQIVLGKQKLDGERKPQPGHKLGGEAERRSIYIQVRRTRPLAILESFDIATQSPNCSKRHFSNVAPQSLVLMNSNFMINYSRKLASRLTLEPTPLEDQIVRGFEICFARKPSTQTRTRLLEFVNLQMQTFREANPKLKDQQIKSLALENLCHALLSSNEFIYVD